jgi:hypothetical protein
MSAEAISALSMNMMNAAPSITTQSAGPAKAIDIARFQAEFEQAQRTDKAKQVDASDATASKPSESIQWLSDGLSSLNARATGLTAEANATIGSGEELKPKDMLMLTVHAHEFLFHCELTSNVANRTSDGITQLFRQQS